MRQQTFTDIEYSYRKKKTKREEFLEIMEEIIPWDEWVGVIEPYYPKGKRGRPPIGLERMLRVYFIQQWYGLSDEGVEDAITDSQALRRFVGIDLSREDAPDATTLLQFRRLLETHRLTEKLFSCINGQLAAQGLLLKEGTIADATILSAPSSTKNREKARDPEMHQTKKGNQWYFGMKAHIGADSQSGLVHTVTGTAAHVADITETDKLLHGEEQVVFLDAGYTGIEKRAEVKEKKVKWLVAMKRGKLKAMPEDRLKTLTGQLERAKASVRAKVEHAFHVLKNLFHYRKVRYKGLFKNTVQLHMLFGLVNLVLVKKKRLALHAQGAS